MHPTTAIFPLMLLLGVVFGTLGAACAYVISLAEYRKQWLRPDQSAHRMALEVAAVTLAFFVVSALVLGFILGRAAHGSM